MDCDPTMMGGDVVMFQIFMSNIFIGLKSMENLWRFHWNSAAADSTKSVFSSVFADPTLYLSCLIFSVFFPFLRLLGVNLWVVEGAW